MKILLALFFITGFIFLVSFLIGCIFLFGKNVPLCQKSAYAIFLAICMFFYLLSSIFVFTGGIIFGEMEYVPYIIFALTPFLIGNIASYKKLKFYTNLQILILLTGCVSSFFVLFTG
ncbi:MAG: hypothetical protein LUE64_05030 [Candidatus Gastranaerophilales bacterium]|nr:hypothetical protein [Candidatus Gastranaerophilales bacterium]